MSKLDEIFHKRLEKIREELNSYIESRLAIAEHKFSAPIPERIPEEEKKDSVQDKFLNYMKLCDEDEEYYDDDYLDELDECLSLPLQEAEQKKPVRLEAPRQLSAHITPN